MPQTPVRLGFIGCGDWAKRKYLPFIESHPHVQLVAISDLVYPGEANLIKRDFPNTQFFPTAEAMITEMKLDGVLVTLPHALHAAAARTTLKKHIPTLVDKPLCLNYPEAQELVRLAEKQKTLLAVASQRRGGGACQSVLQALKENKIGDLLWIKSEFLISSYPGWEQTWRNNAALAGDLVHRQGIFFDVGYHSLDTITYLLKYQEPVRVVADAMYRGHSVDTDAVVILDYPNEVRVVITVSRAFPTGYSREEITVLGSEGYISARSEEINSQKKARILHQFPGESMIETPISPGTSIQPFIDFVSYLGKKQFPTLWEAKWTLPSLKIMDQVYDALTENQEKILRQTANR